MLELQGVMKRLSAMFTLGPLTLVCQGGTTTAVVGPSGAGKSTLLRLLTGLSWPDVGRVVVDGAVLAPSNVLAVRRQRFGVVLQEGGLFPHLTALQNATLLARELRMPSTQLEARVASLLALMRLPPELLSRYPAQLSGGQRQRIALLRALVLDPPVLLMDEPLGALDPLTRLELQVDLKHIFATLQKTVVVVTHDLREAFVLAERLVVLKDGQVVQEGDVESVRKNPQDAFVARFLAEAKA